MAKNRLHYIKNICDFYVKSDVTVTTRNRNTNHTEDINVVQKRDAAKTPDINAYLHNIIHDL